MTQPTNGRPTASAGRHRLPATAVPPEPSNVPTRTQGKEGTTHWLHSYDAFYEYMFPKIRTATFALVREWQTADDITQDALIICERKWTSISGMEKPDLYAQKVARRLALSVLKGRGINQEHPLIEGDLYIKAQEILSAAGVDDSVAIRVTVEGVIRSLPRRQAEIATLRFFLGYREKEIAEHLGIAIGTVKSTISETRKKFKALLAPDTK